MTQQLPVVDDTIVWDVYLSLYKVPALSVALELDIFESLDAHPDTPEGLAQRRDFNLPAVRALLPMLMQLGFLKQHSGSYHGALWLTAAVLLLGMALLALLMRLESRPC